MSYLSVTCLVLMCIVVILSLYETRRSYRIALGCYSVIAVVTAFQALVPYILGISMANAFNSSNTVPLTGYIRPLLTLVGFVYPALSLYPFMSGRSGRIVAFTFAGVSVAFPIFSFVQEAIRWPLSEGGHIHAHIGVFAVFHLLLWLRVYDLRAVTEPA